MRGLEHCKYFLLHLHYQFLMTSHEGGEGNGETGPSPPLRLVSNFRACLLRLGFKVTWQHFRLGAILNNYGRGSREGQGFPRNMQMSKSSHPIGKEQFLMICNDP